MSGLVLDVYGIEAINQGNWRLVRLDRRLECFVIVG